MKGKQIEIIREKDVLGMDKPVNQLKPLKRKNNPGFLILTLIILVIVAAVLFYFKK